MLLKSQIFQRGFQTVNQPLIWFFCRYELSSLLWSFPVSSDALDFVHNLLFYLSPNDDQYQVHLHRHPWHYRLFILILELHPFNCPLLHFFKSNQRMNIYWLRKRHFLTVYSPSVKLSVYDDIWKLFISSFDKHRVQASLADLSCWYIVKVRSALLITRWS